MKSLLVRSLASASVMISVLTAVQPVLADETSTSRAAVGEEQGPNSLSDLGMRINPQLGISSFEYSGTSSAAKEKFSGGATVEFGQGMRKLETGLLLIQAGGQTTVGKTRTDIRSSWLTLPMLAKIRVMQMQSQSWYAKLGFMSAFEVGSNNNAATNNIDVLGTIGAGGRFVFSKNADFIVEATYNRGLLDALSSQSDTYSQGFLVMAGLSFKI